jgi:DNA repair protein RadC
MKNTIKNQLNYQTPGVSGISIKDIPEAERPYEKFVKYGADSLTDSELLAIIIRTGSKGISALDLSRKILSNKSENNLLSIMHISLDELTKIEGIGKVKAIQILCIAELSKRIAKSCAKEKLNFNKPSTIAEYYMEVLRHKEAECLMAIFLNSKCEMIKEVVISNGTVNQTIASPREVYIEALRCNAVNLILLHNHPSGNPEPSKDDIITTRRIKEAGKIIGINVIDHLIIGDNKYISLKEKGFL